MIFQGQSIQVTQHSNTIAKLTFDASGSVNKFDQTTLAEFSQALKIVATLPIQVLIISSAKPAFIVGADITEFIEKFRLPTHELQAWIKNATDIFDALEDLPYATISAIQGYALGGGCETLLATDFRIADKTAVIGLPEVKLGIMPGFGGTVRLARLIGADNAMEWITTGANHNAHACLKVGVIDSIVEPDNLQQAAENLANRIIAGEFDYQQKRQPKLQPLQLNATEQAMSFNLAKGMVIAKVGQHYPAPIMAVETIQACASLYRKEAMEIENKNFVTLAQSPEATAQVGIFMADQAVKSAAKHYSKGVDPTLNAAVLGAGIMGGGIAYQSACNNVAITMKDISNSALTLGLAEASKLLSKQIERGKFDHVKMASILTNITPSLSYSALEHSDVVIEAVTENQTIKQSVLSEAEGHLKDNAVLTSNTSTISITALATALKKPEQFCGMHFFNPVHRMPLVEVIRGEKTADATLNKVVKYAQQLGKTPIVVNDCPGFLVNRVLFPYFVAFNQLIIEGADYLHVDNVMEKVFGWPMGPAYLLDVVGIDTAVHALDVMIKGYPDRLTLSTTNIMQTLFDNNQLGQKNHAGFYQYSTDRKGKLKKLPHEANHNLIKSLQTESKTFTDQEIIKRLMIPMINEMLRCLEEGIVATPEEADIAVIFGLGFPAFRGGLIRYIEQQGLANYLTDTEQYAHLGPLYPATPSLKKHVASNTHYLS